MPIGRYAEQAAEMVDQVAGYLRTKDIDQIVGQAEDLARQRPAVFLGAAFAIGFMAARFLKSTTPSGGYNGYSETRSAHARYNAPYYHERETVGEAELHEREGYPLKTAVQRAQELQASRPTTATEAGSGFIYGGSTDRSAMDLTGDMNDDDLSSDFAEATRVRSSDV